MMWTGHCLDALPQRLEEVWAFWELFLKLVMVLLFLFSAYSFYVKGRKTALSLASKPKVLKLVHFHIEELMSLCSCTELRSREFCKNVFVGNSEASVGLPNPPCSYYPNDCCYHMLFQWLIISLKFILSSRNISKAIKRDIHKEDTQ